MALAAPSFHLPLHKTKIQKKKEQPDIVRIKEEGESEG